MGRTRSTPSTSLPGIHEDHNQLPTPRETPQPEGVSASQSISDTLFDVLDIPFNSIPHQIHTGRSGNPLMTVVDYRGVFEMEVLFCACSKRPSMDVQILKTGLFPATFKQIETLFTFSVLDDFLTDNLECKTTAQQYYSKLQSMTSNIFPDHVPVSHPSIPCIVVDLVLQNRYKQLLRASRQWRDLKNRMKSGIGYESEQDIPQEGSMAIFCPACPQPGLNLPDDWKEKYPSYVPVRCPRCTITHLCTGMRWSEHSSWMGISLQKI